MKTCFKCGIAKPISEFYAHPRMSDGHLGKCITCTKKDMRENREKRFAYYQAADKARNQLPQRKQQKVVRQRVNRAQHPDKYAARTAVGNALRDGRLVQSPCGMCGSLEVEAHHHDYSRPLDVIWLCRSCHRQLHRSLNSQVAA